MELKLPSSWSEIGRILSPETLKMKEGSRRGESEKDTWQKEGHMPRKASKWLTESGKGKEMDSLLGLHKET